MASRAFDPERHCGAKTNPLNGEQPCRQWKGSHTDHRGSGQCWLHGGRSPNGKAHAANEAAERALERLGRPRAVAPQRALLETVWEAAGNVAFLREQAAALGTDLTARESEARTETGRRGTVTFATLGSREDVRAIVKLYGEWCDRLAKYAKAAVDAGIAEREVTLAEQQAAQIVRVIEATLAGLELTPEQRAQGRTLASSQLRLIAASPTAASRN